MPSSATPDISPLSLHDALPICPTSICTGWTPSSRRCSSPSTPEASAGRPTRRIAECRTRRHAPAFVVTVPRRGCCASGYAACPARSEEHTSELQSHSDLVCRLLPPPTSPLFPYTTLFRSVQHLSAPVGHLRRDGAHPRVHPRRAPGAQPGVSPSAGRGGTRPRSW